MTKIQKTYLGIFIAMFALPELLWSPVLNIIYNTFQIGKNHPIIFRANFLSNELNYGIFIFILIIQIIGMGGVIKLIYKKNTDSSHKSTLVAILALILILTILSSLAYFYFYYTFSLEGFMGL